MWGGCWSITQIKYQQMSVARNIEYNRFARQKLADKIRIVILDLYISLVTSK